AAASAVTTLAASPEVCSLATLAARAGPATGATVTVASRPSSSAHSWPSGWPWGGSDAATPQASSASSATGRRASQAASCTRSRLRRLHTPSRSRLPVMIRAVQEQQGAARAVPAVQAPALTAQQWFERGYQATDQDETIRC